MKKLKLKKLKPKLPRIKSLKRTKSVEERVSEAISTVPKITNETVTEHREEVLSGARKYIYPLQHSKHHIVRISLSIFILVILAFFTICGLVLYKFQGTNGFIYDITKIFPVPVAKAGGNWVSYESYLFELRRNILYYTTLQQADFTTDSGKNQLNNLKHQALNTAVEFSLVNKLAAENKIIVSERDVNTQLVLVKSENRLGSSDQIFKEILSRYWGWNTSDFKRELKQQMTLQAVVSKLDASTHERANSVLDKLKQGTDFATLASQVSEDNLTKTNSGQFPNAITLNDQQVSPIITHELFKLNPGQISGIVNTGYTLDILKVLDKSGSTLHASHIQFNFQPIQKYTKPLINKKNYHKYISLH
ncbi:MAG TPA: peptidylprolyl isomerase [Patescibacteria group bacterium]|nr:peptidylprolyl isomerase [Patescibacteria group bacterium]